MSNGQSAPCDVPAFVRAAIKPEVKAINVQRREVLHRISSINPDRIGDVVEPGGVDLRNFTRHPVVLLDHSYSVDRIVGKAIHLEITEDGIDARTQYLDTPLARDAFNLVREGLGAYSIGFKPKAGGMEPIFDEEKNVTGFRIKAWELLEYSQVAIPMNPDAVARAVQKGVVHQENVARLLRAPEPDQFPAESASENPEQKTLSQLLRRLAAEDAAERAALLARRS